MYAGMKNKMTRHLIIELFVVLLFCVMIFSCSTFFMNQESLDAIGNMNDVYMHSMSEELSLHFAEVIRLRFAQMEALMDSVHARDVDPEDIKQRLADEAKLRGFEYLAFYTLDGKLDKIYGNDVELDNATVFADALHNHEKKIALGVGESGKEKIVFGMPDDFHTEMDDQYLALVAGLSMDEVKQTLSLEATDSPLFANIIRLDGSFVAQRGERRWDNYFDQLMAEISDHAEEQVAALRRDMEQTGHASVVLTANGERYHLHSKKLAYTNWFLNIVMPYRSMDAEISKLSRHWLYIAAGGCLVVLVALLFVFGGYFRQIREQMNELDKVREEAVNASRAKSEFLSNMSHDIRTPMNAIVGMTAIAIANMDDKAQMQNCLKKIAMSSKHLLGLINDILDMSKIESGKLTLSMDQLSLREAIDGIVSIIQPQIGEKNHKFDVVIRDIISEEVCCDSVRLTQVLLNLLGNSVKFTPEGGEIRLVLYEEESPKGSAYVQVHLLVEDNGIGMAPEFLDQIFDAFSRADNKRVRKTEGSGLGMAITKYIVDAMKGTIQVQSEQGRGSSFHVILDLEKAQVREEDMVLPSVRVLVVDDDTQLCESAIAALASMGVHADFAFDAKEALKMIAEQYRQQDAYQILLLDWKLPGMDGLALTRMIRKDYGDEIPILLSSAYDWGEMEAEAKAAGVTGFLSKPLFRSTLFYGLKPFLTDETKYTEEETEHILENPEEELAGCKILVAEDNDLNWEIANELLSAFGLELEWAENGQICLDKFCQSQVGYYDAILMDLRMPVMTGYEATEAIRSLEREDAKSIPIIAMTADAFAEDIKHCMDSGMNAHIPKPIDVRDVVRQLKKYIK